MHLSVAIIPVESTRTPQNIQSLLSVEEQAKLRIITEKIRCLFEENRSRIYLETLKNCFRESKHKPCHINILKASTVPVAIGLTAVAGIIIVSSFTLFKLDLSSALSSNIPKRVALANDFTNAGALFACGTDYPAFCYSFYLFVLKNPHLKALHDAMENSYYSAIRGDLTLTPQLHEELYVRYVSKLRSLGVDRYYLNPNRLSRTGALYAELAPTLEEIDRGRDRGVTCRELGKRSVERFIGKPCWKKCEMITVASTSLFVMSLASLLLIENGILLLDTPVTDLQSPNEQDQINEAFYLTQMGGIFSSLTAFGIAGYIIYRVFFLDAYKQEMFEKTDDIFLESTSDTLSSEARAALNTIRQIKLEQFS